MLEFVGNVVAGGWDAVSNVANTVGKGASYVVSGFFPSAQRAEPMESNIAKAAGASGMTYRPTTTDAPTFFDPTIRPQEWMTDPLNEYPSIEVPKKSWGDNLADILRGAKSALAEYGQVRTLVTDIAADWGLVERPTIQGTPRAGYPEGRDERNYNETQPMGANVIEIVRGMGTAFIDQAKGLFNLGFADDTSQGTFALRHEIAPSKKTTIGLVIAAVVIILVILLGRKK